MLRLLIGMTLSLTGLALLLAMVVRRLEPGLAPSLLGYAGVVLGMALAASGAVGLARRR